MRIVVLGGGFGGVTMARHLERRLRGWRDIEITLVSRENFFVLCMMRKLLPPLLGRRYTVSTQFQLPLTHRLSRCSSVRGNHSPSAVRDFASAKSMVKMPLAEPGDTRLMCRSGPSSRI